MKFFRRRSPQFIKKDDEPVYLTADGLARLEGKLARLKRALPGFIEEAQRTAAYGDRSDNAEYKEAKSILRRTSSQILSIEDQLKRIVIISSRPNASGKVELGSTVVLRVEDTEHSGGPKVPSFPEKTREKEKTFRILGSRETDPARGCISNQSPLGAALMGRAKGDTVTINPPSALSGGGGGNGPKTYQILEIR